MKSPDPASLQNLNDIVLPEAAGWWPLASGWYVLIGLFIVTTAWFSYRSLQRWKANRYRRAALHDLQLLTERIQKGANRDASLRQIPVLLKRTALSAYPRYQVAALSGADWHRFLNARVKHPLFTEATFATLDEISYSCGGLDSVDAQSATTLLDASGLWLKQHESSTRSTDSGRI